MRKSVNCFSVSGGRLDKSSYGRFFGNWSGWEAGTGWSNFVDCISFAHALRQFKRLKIKHRQIDLHRPKVGRSRCIRHGKSWKETK